MNDQQKFNERSIKERIAQSYCIKELFKGKSFTYYETDPYGNDIYDGGVVLYDAETGSNLMRYIIETKVRDTHYDELMYETKKHNTLIKKAKELDAKIIYINTTPQGSYIFNITKSIEGLKIMSKVCPKTTAVKGEYIDKKCYLILNERSKFIQYNTNSVLNQYEINNTLYKAEVVIKKDEKNLCIFRDFIDKMDKNDI